MNLTHSDLTFWALVRYSSNGKDSISVLIDCVFCWDKMKKVNIHPMARRRRLIKDHTTDRPKKSLMGLFNSCLVTT